MTRTLVGCTGPCLDPKQCQYPCKLMLVDLRTPIGLALLDFPSSSPHDLLIYAKDGHN
jgi:hypothetical protein